MATYLLAWNPKRWDWPDLAADIRAVATGNGLVIRWSCGSAKQIRVGDRTFLIRLGVEPKGLMGAGTVVRERYDAPHYDPERAARGDVAGRIDVRLNTLVDPLHDPLLSREFLRSAPPFSAMHWDTQMSGVRIPDHIATALEGAWSALATAPLTPLAEEVSDADTLYEGAVKQITINAYERNALARQRCIDHHGTRCAACGIDLAIVYGPVAAGLVHVHHLRPLATLGAAYGVDPIADLRPVCPNCHAVLHARNPPFDIEEVRAFLHDARGGRR